MLKGTVGQASEVTVQGFLVAVELEEGTDVQMVMTKLADALTWVEGIGSIDIDHLGLVDTYDGPEIQEGEVMQAVSEDTATPGFATGKMTES